MSFITTKLLGYVSGGLVVALLLCGAFAALQSKRLGNANDKIASLSESVKQSIANTDLAVSIANQRGTDLKGRDLIIGEQNASIDALAAQAGVNRTVYTTRIAKADVGARANEDRAATIMALPVPAAPDERCTAARTLIEQELLNVR